MSKSYLSGAARRSAREEPAEQNAKIPKISSFVKPTDSAPPPMTTKLESNHTRRLGAGFGEGAEKISRTKF